MISSHTKKEIAIMEMLANAMVVIILQYMSNQHILYRKLKHFYVSILSQ